MEGARGEKNSGPEASFPSRLRGAPRSPLFPLISLAVFLNTLSVILQEEEKKRTGTEKPTSGQKKGTGEERVSSLLLIVILAPSFSRKSAHVASIRF